MAVSRNTPAGAPVQTGHSHLRRLVMLRSIAVAAQCLTLALAYRLLEMQLQWLPMLATIAALGTLNLLTWLRLRSGSPVSHAELFAQLCADVLALSVLLYYGGGSTNPFISLFLLPLVIAAATLPHAYTWAMTAITTACYTLLMKFYVPLPMVHGHGMDTQESDMPGMEMGGMDMPHTMPQDDAFNLHIFGMWLGFVISAVVVSYFVVRMAHAVRERDVTLAKVREETLRNERIVALGTQAAGAAHELGTPLSTMAVVIGELRHEEGLDKEWQDSLALLDGQVRNCRRILDKILDDSRDLPAQHPDEFMAATLEEWRLLRPATECQYQNGNCADVPAQKFDPALRAALLNLLNNAADASPQRITIEANCRAGELQLLIHDYGPGLTPEFVARAGSAFFTTKEAGYGLGLFLANATVERMGGKVRLFNREGGGATTEVILPLQPPST